MNINNQHDLTLIKSGKDRDINKLFEKYNKLIYGFYYKKTKNIDTAQDLTQDVLMKINDKLNDFDPTYPFNTWVFKIINNHLNDYYRHNNTKSKKIEHTFLDVSEPETHSKNSMTFNLAVEDFDNKNMLEYINNKVKYILSDTEYQVYKMKMINDYTYDELMVEFNFDRKKIFNIVSKIRNKIRNNLYPI